MGTFDDVRLLKILAGRRAVARFPMPGAPDHEVGIRVLAEGEIDEARVAAILYVEGRAKKADLVAKDVVDIDPEFIEREMQRQVLFRACVDVDSDPADPAPFFRADAQVRRIDAVVVEALWRHYLAHLEDINPALSLSDEAVEELVDALGKERDGLALWPLLSPGTQRLLARTMASRLASSPPTRSSTTPSSSTSTPSETPTTAP